jgi:hypothetical protein
MFGGLDVKQSSTATAPPDETSSPTGAPPAVQSSSSFGFLTAAAPVPSSSGFSFLNTPTLSHDESDASKQAPLATPVSAFSFLSGGATGVTAGTPSSQGVVDKNKAAGSLSTNNNNHDESLLASFVTQPTTTTTVTQHPFESTGSMHMHTTTNNNNSAHESVASMSFLAATTSTDTISTLGQQSTTTTNNADPPSAPAGESLMDAVYSSTTTSSNNNGAQHQPVGSGMTFGGAGIKAVKKKRLRTAKIGAAAHPEAPHSPQPHAPQPPPLAAQALAAQQRAEEFLAQKEQADARLAAQQQQQQQQQEEADEPRLTRNPSQEDSVIAAAKAAALEAQEQMAKQQSSFSSRMMGGLFQRRSPPPSQLGSTSSIATAKAPTAAERLQMEQEEVKRAISERHMAMMRSTSTTTSSQKDDNNYNEEYDDHRSQPAPPSPPNVPVRAMSAPAFQPPQQQQHFATISVPKTNLKTQVVKALPPSATETFTTMLTDFRNRVVTNMDNVTRLRQHRSGLLEERFVTAAKERLAAQQRDQAQAQQHVAVKDEDYELAEQLQMVMEAHERERLEFAAVRESIARALQELDGQKTAVIASVTQEFERIQVSLKAFQSEQETKESSDSVGALKLFAAEKKQLDIENDRLQQDLKHMERDAKLVEEERKEVEAAISEQTGAFELLRDDAKEKLKTVEDEIDELRKQLVAKQRIAAQLRTEHAGHDESILKVRVKFTRQVERVTNKERSIASSKLEWEEEKKQHDKNREAYDAKVMAHTDAQVQREQLLESLSKEVLLADTFGDIVAKEIGVGLLPNEEDELDSDLAQMQADVVKCEAAFSEAKTVLKVILNSLTKLETEVEALETRLPLLEDIKTAAAAQRDFKAAGKASKEIKEATARMKDCKDEIVEAIDKKSSAEEEVASLEKQLEEKRSISAVQERESSIAAMQRLADNIKRLVATKKSVCSDAKDLSIKGVGAFVIQSQIKSLKMEGETYGEKYGGWDELMSEIEDLDEEVLPTESAGDDQTQLQAEQGEVTVDVDAAAEVADEKPSVTADPVIKLSSEEKRTRYRYIMSRFAEVETAVESAAEAEDFEKAAELDDELQQLATELQSLDLTDTEMEAAMSDPLSEPAQEAALAEIGGTDDIEDQSPSTDEDSPIDAAENEPATREPLGDTHSPINEEKEKKELLMDAGQSDDADAEIATVNDVAENISDADEEEPSIDRDVAEKMTEADEEKLSTDNVVAENITDADEENITTYNDVAENITDAAEEKPEIATTRSVDDN